MYIITGDIISMIFIDLVASQSRQPLTRRLVQLSKLAIILCILVIIGMFIHYLTVDLYNPPDLQTKYFPFFGLIP